MSVHTRSAFRRPEGVPDLMPSQTLDEVLGQRAQEREQKMVDFLEWALKLPEPKTGTLDFNRYAFQRELYEAPDTKEVVVKKASQVGISAFLVRWIMFWADVRGLTGLYVFPKLKHMYEFADARVRPIILASDYLQSRIPGVHVQNKGLKQIGLGFVNFRGSESKDDLDSVDADVLALDEYDRLVAANIPDAERRIANSTKGLLRRVGNPTIPEYGISKLYDRSDRREWMVKCARCNEHQVLDFWENVDQVRGLVMCAKCAKPLDVTEGQWVAEFPDRDVRGYHLSRLMVPETNLDAVIAASRATEVFRKQTFFNKDLGLEWAPEEGRLSPKAVAAAQREFTMTDSYAGDNLVTMGVDVASARALNVRVSEHLSENTKKALWIGTVGDESDGFGAFESLARLMDRFGVKMCVIDNLPETRMSLAFASRFHGRVYLCYYAQRQKDVLAVDDEQMRVSVRRTEAIDATTEMVRQQRNMLPLDLPDDYVSQMGGEVRVQEEDEMGKVTVAYRKVGPSDYLHAEVYDLVATECFWVRQQVEDSQRQELRPLDDYLDFQRASQDPDEVYRPGPEEDLGQYEWDEFGD